MDTLAYTILGAVLAFLLGIIAYFIKKILDKTENIEEDIKPITPAIIEIQGILADRGHKLKFPITLTSQSPLRPTEYGEKLLRESGFYDALKEHRDFLARYVKNKNPRTNYDIQELSIQTIQELSAQNHLSVASLKRYAYNEGMPLEILIKTAGIVLRDEVMKELKFNDNLV